MIKNANAIQEKPINVYVTTTLLNAWSYIFQSETPEKALADFVNTLAKVRTPPNEYMIRGIEFEDACVRGEVPGISEVIAGGMFQAVATKNIVVQGINVLMYGKLDCLKAGAIYDIKRVSKYETQKYFDSYQHHFYLTVVPEAYVFHYLINNGENTYWETYRRDEMIDMSIVIGQFFDWLRTNGLFPIFRSAWQSKQKE